MHTKFSKLHHDIADAASSRVPDTRYDEILAQGRAKREQRRQRLADAALAHQAAMEEKRLEPIVYSDSSLSSKFSDGDLESDENLDSDDSVTSNAEQQTHKAPTSTNTFSPPGPEDTPTSLSPPDILPPSQPAPPSTRPDRAARKQAFLQQDQQIQQFKQDLITRERAKKAESRQLDQLLAQKATELRQIRETATQQLTQLREDELYDDAFLEDTDDELPPEPQIQQPAPPPPPPPRQDHAARPRLTRDQLIRDYLAANPGMTDQQYHDFIFALELSMQSDEAADLVEAIAQQERQKGAGPSHEAPKKKGKASSAKGKGSTSERSQRDQQQPSLDPSQLPPSLGRNPLSKTFEWWLRLPPKKK